MPVHTLQFDVCVILLEVEIQCFVEIDIWPFDSKVILFGSVELRELKVLRKDFHFSGIIIIII